MNSGHSCPSFSSMPGLPGCPYFLVGGGESVSTQNCQSFKIQESPFQPYSVKIILCFPAKLLHMIDYSLRLPSLHRFSLYELNLHHLTLHRSKRQSLFWILGE